MEHERTEPPASPWGSVWASWQSAPPPAPPPPAVAAPPPVPAPPPAAPAAPTTVVLRLDQGTELPLDRWWVLGRSPAAPPERPDAVPFAVPDAMRSLSKTHLVVGPAPGGATVVDVHSVNGSRIRPPDGSVVDLVAGVPTVAPWGSTVEYGLRTLVVGMP